MIEQLLQRYGDAKTHKSLYENTLSEVGKYVWPAMQTMVRSVESDTEGQVLTVDIYDSTAIDASYRMTSGIFSYLMPVGSKWFEFTARSYEDNEDPMVQMWLSKAGQAVHKEIWRSNFQREMFTTVRSLTVFGTACISVEKVDKDVNFQCWHIGDIFFEENSKGYIDTVFRKITYTARQAKQEFGDNCGETVKRELSANPASNAKFEFVHCCFPNADYDGKYGSKKFASVFISVSDTAEVKPIKNGSGYDSMPYLIARFAKSPNEIMGRSPAIEFLPEIKMLNSMRMTFLQSSEKEGNPPLIVEDDAVVGQPVTSAGGLIVIRSGAMIPTPLKTGSNAQLNSMVIAEQRQVVKEAFFNDLFNALANYRNMTATEVVQRVEEKMVLLAPAISALQKELFDPLIVRVLSLMDEEVIEKKPEGLDLNVVYQGRLALAMSNMQTNAIESTLAKWSPYMESHPEIFDNIDFDKSFRMSAINAGVPAEVLMDVDDRDAMRQARNATQQAAADAQIAVDASTAYKNVTGAMEKGSLAEALL